MKRRGFARFVVLITVASLCSVATNANGRAANDGDTRAAYRAALKCFVTNGNASAERRRAGDQAGAARYEASAKRSFDGAIKLGGMLGLANRQMNHDLDVVQATELPRMVKDRDYFIDAVATCKGLGLM